MLLHNSLLQVKSAAVGDSLELHFNILDLDSPYEIFVRELIAKDGNDQNEIVLLDSIGCPTEGRILGPLGRDASNPKSLMARFDAFKFPTSEIVQFRALVTPCMPKCKPVECVYQDFYGGDNTRINSYGKRKRRSSLLGLGESAAERWVEGGIYRRSVDDSQQGDDVLVTHAFVITEKFANKKSPEKTSANPLNTFTSAEEKDKHMTDPVKNYYGKDSLSFTGGDTNTETASKMTPSSETFSPDNLEVCLNLTGLIVGIGVFLTIQLVLVFVWTHFWQTRQKKKRGDLPSSSWTR